MKNLRAAIAASLFAASLAACTEGSTVPDPRAPAFPSRDGGMGYGSGNVVPTDTSTNTSAADPAGTTATEAADSATLERGGMGYGSGN
ncbi:MAG TPA: hypothetical protein VF647_24270 [Longimicrobium sp.]|jgi:hypothetical protein